MKPSGILATSPLTLIPDCATLLRFAAASVAIIDDAGVYSHKQNENRARIKSQTGASWLTVPVLTQGRQGQLLRDVEINQDIAWRPRLWKTLNVNYQLAAYFEKYDLYLEALFRREWSRLHPLSTTLTRFVLGEMLPGLKLHFTSELELEKAGAERISEIANRFGCDTYLADPALEPYLTRQNQQVALPQLRYQPAPEIPYYQLFGSFIPNLSAIDLLLNEGDQVQEWLRKSGSVQA